MSDLFTPYTQIQDYDGGIFEYWQDKFDDNPNPYPLLTEFVTSSNYVDLDIDYHEVFSSEKYLSRVSIRFIEYYIRSNYGDTRNIFDLLPNGRFDLDDKNDIIQFLLDNIADLIYNRFAYKWKKIYDALTTNYNPLENYNMVQTRTPNITREEVIDIVDERTPDITRTDTFDTTDTRTPNLTTSGEDSATTEVGIYGFNSTSGNNSTNSDGESSSSQSVTGTDTNAKTGTITNEETGSDITTKTGTNTNTETGTEDLTRSGNIGVTTSQQMLESELKLREYDFYKTIYKDIDSILCLGVY